jgi:hypothetical protein
MEEKIVGEKKGSSLFSFISLSIASLLSVFTHTAPALDLPPHSGSPTHGFYSIMQDSRYTCTHALHYSYGMMHDAGSASTNEIEIDFVNRRVKSVSCLITLTLTFVLCLFQFLH